MLATCDKAGNSTAFIAILLRKDPISPFVSDVRFDACVGIVCGVVPYSKVMPVAVPFALTLPFKVAAVSASRVASSGDATGSGADQQGHQQHGPEEQAGFGRRVMAADKGEVNASVRKQ